MESETTQTIDKTSPSAARIEESALPSQVAGKQRPPLIRQTIDESFRESVARWPDREALVFRQQGIRWTYRRLDAEVEAFARGLVGLGFEIGDRLGIWSPNKVEWIVTQLAAARAGLILVNLNPAYRLAEIEFALTDVACKGVVLADRFKSSDYVGMMRDLAPELDACAPGELVASRFPELRTAILISDREERGFLRFSEVQDRAPEGARLELEERASAISPDDPVNIQFTSGTTGTPKGATLTHLGLLNNGYLTAELLRFTERDRLCVPVPLYHCFGTVLSVLACITHGATLVFPGEAFVPEEVLAAVAEERCTALHGVPTMFVAELEHEGRERFDLSSLRTGIMAGAPCPIEVMRRVIDEMHLSEITICYGMTETSPVSFQTSTEDPIERRVATVGRVHPHVEVKIVDAGGEIVPRGVPGEICTRGYCVMAGYWGDERRSREVIDDDGWMHTGDLGTLDAEGYCNIVGRLKDMVIRGGENIYPREIEEFLYRHPRIQEVAVFGVPDPKMGEQIAAWVKPHPGDSLEEEEVRDFCRGKIAHYKVPTYVKIVESFPMTVTGKIQKFLLRELMSRELGLARTLHE